MSNPLVTVIEKCVAALQSADPQGSIETILHDAAAGPAVADTVAGYAKFSSLDDLAIHRSESLTLLAGSLPPGFSAAPHNHNLWSVVSVCRGQEDNRFFRRNGDGLEQIGEASVVGPGTLANDADVIHAIRNPLETPLLVLHAYGGDLFATPRSNWDPVTHKEVPYDWKQVRSD
ncbi:MAG TPA: hypothetical protein VKQ06_05250 [Gammaproteobacteria bacterium]|nr:hypothetical protein [Gammaproteobacteria bacterium]